MPVGKGSVREWAMQFHGLPARGIDLVLKTKGETPYKVLLVDRSYGLVDTGNPIVPRASYMISSPQPISDVSLIAKSFEF
jgi:hypothetical protein